MLLTRASLVPSGDQDGSRNCLPPVGGALVRGMGFDPSMSTTQMSAIVGSGFSSKSVYATLRPSGEMSAYSAESPPRRIHQDSLVTPVGVHDPQIEGPL